MKTELFVRGAVPGLTKLFKVDSDDTVYSVMAQIEDVMGAPPVMQRIQFNTKLYYHDTPGTLAEHKLVDLSSPDNPNTVGVSVLDYRDRLHRKTLVDLGFPVSQEDVADPSLLRLDYPGQEKMFITLTDHIRMDGGWRRMVLLVAAEYTVASLMEQVRRSRRYPVAMQQFTLRDADGAETPMDKLDATVADYGLNEDSQIHLHMNMEFAFQLDREMRGKGVSKANKEEIAAPQKQLAGEEK